MREIGTLVEHSEEDSLHRQIGIVEAANSDERVKKLRDTLQGEVLALHRHNDGIRGDKRIESEEVEGWRAIQKDVVKLVAELLHPLSQSFFALRPVHQFDGSSNQILVRRNEVESLEGGFLDKLHERDVEHKGVVEGAARGIFGEAEASRGVGLGVAIYDQSPHVAIGQCSAQIDGSSGLSHAALLIGNSDDSSQGPQPKGGKNEFIKSA